MNYALFSIYTVLEFKFTKKKNSHLKNQSKNFEKEIGDLDKVCPQVIGETHSSVSLLPD